MKVLHVIDRLAIGGAERVFITATTLLLQSDVEVAGMIFNEGYPLEKEIPDNLKLHVLNRKNKYSLQTLYKAHRTFSKYDIVHVHLRHVYTYARLAQFLFHGKYKLVLHDHSRLTQKPPKRLAGIFRPQYYIGVDTVQTTWAHEVLKIEKPNIFLLENVVLPKPVSKSNVVRKDAMMISNIRRYKKIEVAIQLIKQTDLSLTIYGNILDQDYYKELIELIGDNKKINIVEGVSDFSDIYPRYTIAIHCSTDETGPLVLQEYMSAGLPFIAYDHGSVARSVSKELPELFMKNTDPDQWSKQIINILSLNGIEKRMKQAFEKHFSPKKYTTYCLEIYRKISS